MSEEKGKETSEAVGLLIAHENDWKFKTHTECDVCRKILVATGGTVWFSQLSGDNEEERKEVQRNLGNYQIGKQYTICWECILRRLGVKP